MLLTRHQASRASRRCQWRTFRDAQRSSVSASESIQHLALEESINRSILGATRASWSAPHKSVTVTRSIAPVRVIRPASPKPVVSPTRQEEAVKEHFLQYWQDTVEALQQNAASVVECELPMNMECGCKTKRQKEKQEAETMLFQQQLAAGGGNVVNRTAVSFESTWYRRLLPQECIAFSSPEGKKLFREAINSQDNYMQIYFPLAEQFITQAEPAFCGLATLAMCLNALQIDPGRLWKGPWRWYSEELFDCCTSLAVAKEKGISLSEFICLARCNGVLTEDVRANSSLSLDQFRSIVKRCCATSSEIVVLNYSRKVLGQTGDGHFSPIGGYHAESDMVLLMDVARFKYPPHWVKLSLVFEAMQRLDESIGLPRGLVILKENAHATGPTQVKSTIRRPSQVSASAAGSSHEGLVDSTPCCSNAAAVQAARIHTSTRMS